MGDALAALNAAAKEISKHAEVKQLRLSRFYLTTPVSNIPQDDYINAVCSVHTTLGMRPFFDLLKSIEIQFGKTTSNQIDGPRPIDLDLLFFGEQVCSDEDLIVPHPRWKNRLFVLKPLSDLTDIIIVPCGRNSKTLEIIHLENYMQTFANPNNETIRAQN